MSKPTSEARIQDQQTIPGIDLDKPVPSSAVARTVIGEVIEVFCADLVNGYRLQINSNCICPDIKSKYDVHSSRVDPIYYECKSVGQSKSSHLFKSRVDKYHEWMYKPDTENKYEILINELHYIYVFHDGKWEEGDTEKSLGEKVIHSIYRVLVIHANKLHTALNFLPVAKFNITGRPELNEGWRLSRIVLDMLWVCSEKNHRHPFGYGELL